MFAAGKKKNSETKTCLLTVKDRIHHKYHTHERIYCTGTSWTSNYTCHEMGSHRLALNMRLYIVKQLSHTVCTLLKFFTNMTVCDINMKTHATHKKRSQESTKSWKTMKIHWRSTWPTNEMVLLLKHCQIETHSLVQAFRRYIYKYFFLLKCLCCVFAQYRSGFLSKISLKFLCCHDIDYSVATHIRCDMCTVPFISFTQSQ